MLLVSTQTNSRSVCLSVYLYTGEEQNKRKFLKITYHYSAVLILRDLNFLKEKKETLITIMKIFSATFKIIGYNFKIKITYCFEPFQFMRNSMIPSIYIS